MNKGQTEAPHGAELAISRILKAGVEASLFLIATGSLLSFVQAGTYGSLPSDVARLTGPGGAFPRTAAWLAGGIVHLRGQAIIVSGLLLLIATPVLRVAASVVAFALERDRAFVAITAVVLLLLLASFALGGFV
jgi:uncharacterized membrane protein